MKYLNGKELSAATSIINAGLSKAAESLSFFMKETISFKELSFNVNQMNADFGFTAKSGENIHLLITQVIGELKGVCCLIFSEAEADQLRVKALPPEITTNPELMKEMSDAIMLEVDNIISAAVVTQFSNFLNHKIHGGVPDLKKLNRAQINDYALQNFSEDLFSISFKIRFQSSQLDFNPEFVWLFDDSFLAGIKSFASDEERLKKLESLTITK